MPLDLIKGEEIQEEPVSTTQPVKDPDLSLLLSFVKYKKGQ